MAMPCFEILIPYSLVRHPSNIKRYMIFYIQLSIFFLLFFFILSFRTLIGGIRMISCMDLNNPSIGKD
uniref:Uncharacterized protein n=1 Tax=Lepeophtheirus salmonis TaxID=72036 RepID=A0A0K2T348_LEPSM